METLLELTLGAQLILFGFTGVSMFAPEHRVWPPPSRHSWQIYATWFLSWVSLSGAFLLAVLGGNSLGLPIWLRLGVGVPIFGLGVWFCAWGFRELSLQTTVSIPAYAPLVEELVTAEGVRPSAKEARWRSGSA